MIGLPVILDNRLGQAPIHSSRCHYYQRCAPTGAQPGAMGDAMPDLPFAKGHALGNDYLILDAADLPWQLTPERIRALCDRNRGIGSDGILLAMIGDDRFQLRIFNPDGTEAEESGNGLRIFAAFLHYHGLVGTEPFPVQLPGETITIQVLGEGPTGDLEVALEVRGGNKIPDGGTIPLHGPAQIIYRGVVRGEVTGAW